MSEPEKKKKICGMETEVYSRVVGYYRPVTSFNLGKQREFKDRKMYKVEGRTSEGK